MKTRKPLRLIDDDEHTLEVIRWAEEKGLPIRRPGPHHIKVGPWNYYPSREAFNCDHKPAERQIGFEEFKRAVARWMEGQRRELQSLEE